MVTSPPFLYFSSPPKPLFYVGENVEGGKKEEEEGEVVASQKSPLS